MTFFTQITMEAAEDRNTWTMSRARIRGALVGIESVTPEGLKDVYKDFNLAGDALAERLQNSRSAASTCSARSSSGCRATSRRRSTPPRRSRSRPTSRSRSS
jgi:hypothetical protein